MEHSNKTSSVKFILLGLSSDPYLQVVYFLVFLGIYLITLSGNLLLIIVVRINPKLQTPMYFFLSHLSIVDLCFSSTIVPKLLLNTLSEDTSISLDGCAAQMFFSLVLGAAECLLLAVMAFDRYAAICKPLHYNSIMNKRLCIGLAFIAWSGGSVNATIHVVLTFQLPYCKSHHVNNFFCEVPPFLRMSCRDPRLNEIAMYTAAGIISLCAFLLTLISYVHIISTILKIRSSQGRQKAFSTCASHLTVVTLYYGTIMFIYLQPRSSISPEANKAVSIVYTVITPMLNPIIYSIRNKDIKGSIIRIPPRQSNGFP
ncbi:PREDICTED: olfactory receptor-like protein OLF1 [Nanorana parkeri]|uniref:olfactory receptor-like protein OLF1 n=1 Tax=Nanorana parkeri TaxID=125878 RepID=UPI000854E185|nr:PREDICTED: olfactory receptor-like protein OLF1 [Nanorana parkeri]